MGIKKVQAQTIGQGFVHGHTFGRVTCSEVVKSDERRKHTNMNRKTKRTPQSVGVCTLQRRLTGTHMGFVLSVCVEAFSPEHLRLSTAKSEPKKQIHQIKLPVPTRGKTN